ncbi:unnamed protein product [marine sediment metagenome]|uniref:Uncharacterized protein n=1 Tax=marine sediment metagenome TaxID=412755 RepID=X1KB25_9ZZZZ
MITKKQVRHMAELARLRLTSEEVEKYQKQLIGILDYVDKLKKAETKNIQPCTGGTNLQNVFREDKPEVTDKKVREKLLNSAPIRRGDFIKTRAVFGNKKK